MSDTIKQGLENTRKLRKTFEALPITQIEKKLRLLYEILPEGHIKEFVRGCIYYTEKESLLLEKREIILYFIDNIGEEVNQILLMHIKTKLRHL